MKSIGARSEGCNAAPCALEGEPVPSGGSFSWQSHRFRRKISIGRGSFMQRLCANCRASGVHGLDDGWSRTRQSRAQDGAFSW